MGLYERYGARFGFADKMKPFFYITLIFIAAVLLLGAYAVLYDVPETMKLKVCASYLTATPKYQEVFCGYCDQLKIKSLGYNFTP